MRKLNPANIWMSLVLGVALVTGAAAQQPERPRPEPREPEAPATTKQEQKQAPAARAAGEAAAEAQAQAGRSSAALAAGSTVEAVLTKPVDARRNKEGDEVQAKVTKDVLAEGDVVIPKNSKLLGRVTRAQARGRGQAESALAVVFDRAVLKDGTEIPVNVVIQAIAAAQTQAALGDEPMMAGSAAGAGQASGRSSSGGLVGGVTSTAGATVGAVGQTAGAAVGATGQAASSVAGPAATLALDSNTQGVIGIRGLTLNAEASNSTQGSVITSSSRNVRLESGTRLLLRAEAQSQ
jgi:hypothetical protein